MWKSLLLVFLYGAFNIYGEINWTDRARLVESLNFFHNAVQETVYEIEDLGFCNLKIPDIEQTLNEHMYKWHITGTLTYTNGFLISIQKIDTDRISHSIRNNNENTTTASITGKLNFRDVRVGFDILANLTNEGYQRYTGVYVYTLIEFTAAIRKNLNTKEITTSVLWDNIAGERNLRMIYMPANNVTEVLSRRFVPSSISSGVRNWGTRIAEILLKKVSVASFPKICYNCA